MPLAHLGRGARLRHGDIGGQRRAAEGIQADLGHQVPLRAERRRHARGRLQFDLVPLPVIERERVAGVALAPRQRQAGGGIEAAAQQADRFVLGKRATVSPL